MTSSAKQMGYDPQEHRGLFSGCWEWTGALTKGGYGNVTLRHGDGRRTYRVHRVVYEALVGPIPEGMFLCHKCDNRRCFRPDHLFPGTALDNATDMIRKDRGWKVLTLEQVQSVYDAVVVDGFSLNHVAKRLGVCHATLVAVIHGATWRRAFSDAQRQDMIERISRKAAA